MMRQHIRWDRAAALFCFIAAAVLVALSLLVGTPASSSSPSSDSARNAACWDAMLTHYRNGGSDDPPSECRGVPAATMEKFHMQLLGDQ